MGTISYSKTDGLKVVGKPPYNGGIGSAAFTIRMVDALLKLPPREAIDILVGLDDQMAASFRTIVACDSKLTKAYNDLVAQHRAPAPKKASRKIRSEEILEELEVGISPIAYVLFMVDGERRVSRNVGNHDDTLTFDEFRREYDMDVYSFLQTQIKLRMKNYERVLRLISAEPKPVDVSLMYQNFSVGTKRVVMYDPDQLKAYAARLKASVTDFTPATKETA